jgi:hypothetical protein
MAAPFFVGLWFDHPATGKYQDGNGLLTHDDTD